MFGKQVVYIGTIVCEGCLKAENVSSPYDNVLEMLRKRGWRIQDSITLCPTCSNRGYPEHAKDPKTAEIFKETYERANKYE